jgi:phosphoribosylformylglycinamidine cyclo-ligase
VREPARAGRGLRVDQALQFVRRSEEVLDPASWQRPSVYAWLDERGVPEEEQRSVFNLGVGYCAVVPAAEAARAGLPVIGRLEEGVAGVAWADER